MKEHKHCNECGKSIIEGDGCCWDNGMCDYCNNDRMWESQENELVIPSYLTLNDTYSYYDGYGHPVNVIENTRKVYCGKCKHFKKEGKDSCPECKHPNAYKEGDNWEKHYIVSQSPEDKNEDNDCEDYLEK